METDHLDRYKSVHDVEKEATGLLMNPRYRSQSHALQEFGTRVLFRLCIVLIYLDSSQGFACYLRNFYLTGHGCHLCTQRLFVPLSNQTKPSFHLAKAKEKSSPQPAHLKPSQFNSWSTLAPRGISDKTTVPPHRVKTNKVKKNPLSVICNSTDTQRFGDSEHKTKEIITKDVLHTIGLKGR